MGMEITMTNDPLFFHLADATGRIGSLFYLRVDEDDPAEGWMATMAKVRGIGWWQSGPRPTVLEAVRDAHGLYTELLHERPWLARFYRNQRTRVVSIPMGGQPHR